MNYQRESKLVKPPNQIIFYLGRSMSQKKVEVFIVDDHPMVIEGLRSLINHLPDMLVCGAAENAQRALEALKRRSCDIVLLDINLPDMSGVDLCKKIKKEFPDLKILGISTFSERSYISRMIENGASGYLIKNASATEIAAAIGTVMAGKLYMNLDMEHLLRPSAFSRDGKLPDLTRREKEILGYIAEGFTNNEIAQKLFISPSTVDTHRKNMLTKLDVKNTAALIRVAVEKGLI